ncbi:glutamine ABC transporter permease [Suicoccus acidiformans]|uniref:Glutamine ABC transporter permease n=1 Tax=Suicoccus acidiformans TaxID=2036206 RepID=A0A347WLS2_9LACT|nr:ABC transporter substrate-binding protein/permease [Suicoccus acidiformans]AXY26029.1 glutamine ABC transporter permease [Suicoccus acidiformans]
MYHQSVHRTPALCMLFFFTLSLLFVPHVNAQEKGSPENPYIIATDTTFAPFEFANQAGDFVGIDMDILEVIATEEGFSYEVKPLGFNAALQALESNQADGMIAGMGITPARQEIFDFSIPYYEAGAQFAVLENSDIQTLEDLAGKNIAAKTGTTGSAVAEQVAAEYGFNVTLFEDSVNMYEDLQAGNSVAVIEDYPVMAYAAKTGGIPLRFIGEQMEVTQYGFAVNKGRNQELLQMFNDGLLALQESDELEAIIYNYLGEENTEAQASSGFFGLLRTNSSALLEGLWSTVWVTLVSFAIAAVIGVFIGLMRVSDANLLRTIAQVYIDMMRGIPLIVLAFFIYFGIPQMTGLSFNAYIAGIITLSLNAGAYIAEIVRGGIQAVDKGQNEAGRSLGLSSAITMRKIILPQAFKIMVPSFINQFVITLKDTSILSVIGLVELTQTGRIIIARTYQSGQIWLIIGLIYIIVITLLTKLSNYLEKEWISNE